MEDTSGELAEVQRGNGGMGKDVQGNREEITGDRVEEMWANAGEKDRYRVREKSIRY